MFKITKKNLSVANMFIFSIVIIFIIIFGIKIFFTKQSQHIPIYKVNTNKKIVALTFDVSLSNNKENLKEILDILDKYNIKATFFLTGEWIDNNKDMVELIDQRGHEIGNNSDTHPCLNKISNQQIKEEIQVTSRKIKSITGKETRLFRPPFGEIDEDGMNICKELNCTVVKWDVDSMDWKNIGVSNIVDRVSRNTSPGSIVLFHCDFKDSKYYLEPIIHHLQDDGFKMVTVSDLLYKDNYYVDSSGIQRLK